jgi:hypothetical protein
MKDNQFTHEVAACREKKLGFLPITYPRFKVTSVTVRAKVSSQDVCLLMANLHHVSCPTTRFKR